LTRVRSGTRVGLTIDRVNVKIKIIIIIILKLNLESTEDQAWVRLIIAWENLSIKMIIIIVLKLDSIVDSKLDLGHRLG